MGKRIEEISTYETRDTFCFKSFEESQSGKWKPTVGKGKKLGRNPPAPRDYLYGFLLSLVLFHHLLTQ